MQNFNKSKCLKISAVILLFIIYYFVVTRTGFYIPCLFHKITGLKCPGCGISTMYVNMASFNLKEAFFNNPVIFCSQPFLYYFIIKIIYMYIQDKKIIFNKFENIILYSYIAILIVFGIARNLLTFL